jgi:hypothetical protein
MVILNKIYFSSFFQLDESAAQILNELQQKLNTVLDDLATIFAKST